MRISLLIVQFLFLSFGYIYAQENSLRGLDYIAGVIIEDFPDELQGISLSEQRIKTDIELKLRQNGVTINKDSTESYLYININSVDIEYNNGATAYIVYSVEIELNQTAYLARDFSIREFGVTTWSTGVVGYASPSRARNAILDFVMSLFNGFLNDYLEVNPK